MPYLIYTQKNQLLLINHSVKNGLYSQTLSFNGLSRPLSIHRNPTSQYSVTLDHNQDLHIITQPSPEQIIHLHYKDNNLTRNIILEDPKGIYHFSNIHVTALKEHVHLFYTANQPIGESYDLIHHILCQENKSESYPIMSFSQTHLGFRYLSHKDSIYILYGDVLDQYSLYLMMYDGAQWHPAQLVSTSSFPIDDFQLCIDNQGTIHLVYIQEKYGRYHLLHKKKQNNIWSTEALIHTTSSNINPSIFTYHQGIWITYVDNNQLHMILSMDNGNRFSQSVRCSLPEGDLEPCNFVWATDTMPDSFNGTILYALISPTIRVGVICNIDMVGLHPDISPNTELELFIDGVFYAQAHTTAPAPVPVSPPAPIQALASDFDLSADLALLQRENEELKQAQQQMIEQYNDMTELTKKIQEEGKKWRARALAVDQPKSQDPLV